MTKTIKSSKWRTVIHRDGRKASAYEVSDVGEVRSYVPTGYATELLSEPRLLKGSIRTAGYQRANILFDGGRRRYVDFHVMVCCAFNGPPPPSKNLVRHLDGNKLNTYFSNLAWGDAKDNAADAVKHGTARSQ